MYQYLAEFVEGDVPESLELWVSRTKYRLVEEAARTLQDDRLKPVFEHLGGAVPYEDIRLVLTHLRAVKRPDSPVR